MRAFLILLLSAQVVYADIVTPTRTVRPGSVITSADVTAVPGQRPGVFDRIADVVGQEARVALYAGRPIAFDAIGPPAIVDRNQIVPLSFNSGGLTINTEGRALERGGIGDRIRVMNLSSRTTIFGFVQQDGTIKVIQ